MNQTAAYESVFLGRGDTASVGASKLMKRPDIQAAIAEAIAARTARVEVTADEVLLDLQEVKRTSVNELIEWRVGACRFCYGTNFEYQRKPSEYRDALAGYLLLNGQTDPLGLNVPMLGGVGYDLRRTPHPECPECWGEGVGREHIKDSRHLSKGAHTLYGGVKRGKNGVEVLMRSKDKAMDLLARHTGVAKDNVTIKGKITAAVATAVAPITTADPQEAARVYQSMMSDE
jgi:hypothetical protein